MDRPWSFARFKALLKYLGLASAGGVVVHAVDVGGKISSYVYDRKKLTSSSSDLSSYFIKSCGDGTNIYDVSYTINIKNTSKQDVNISYSIFNIYISDRTGNKFGFQDIKPINMPQVKQQHGAGDFIEWKKLLTLYSYNPVSQKFSIFQGNANGKIEMPSDVSKLFKDNFGYAGGNIDNRLVGIVPPKSDISENFQYYIRARPSDYLAIYTLYGIDDSVQYFGPNVNSMSELTILSNSEDSPQDDDAGSGVSIGKEPCKI